MSSPGFTQKVRDICLKKATAAIREACRELEPEGTATIISDLSSHEIENHIINAVTKALK